VQGVGFRPTICREAQRAGLTGSVQNRTGTVRIVLEGRKAAVEQFLHDFPARLPLQARLDALHTMRHEEIEHQDRRAVFEIIPSLATGEDHVVIPADLAMCSHCATEIFDPDDRRYGYPFTTCTDCGPRYTVVNGMPYDRQRTTLAEFPLCDQCREEYTNPADRRFHAESIACPRCGPNVWLINEHGERIEQNPIRTARQMLAEGRILAVRGIGGYLLAAHAFDEQAIMTLRERKCRPHKPFAVMAPSLDIIRRYCEVPDAAATLLLSPGAPIVILALCSDRSTENRRLPTKLITPDTQTLGIMLPTSPLHQLLLQPLNHDPVPAFDMLIMTSANKHSEPICISNDGAREHLTGIADGMLMHNREINLRNDDSVCIIQGQQPQVWRRARGYAPEPIRLTHPLKQTVLAMGGELKNTLALATGYEAVLSPHIGDLETPSARKAFQKVLTDLPAFLRIQPACVALDLHPDMYSVIQGLALAKSRQIPVIRVQHHHAHAVSCMAEHGLAHSLALVFDGTGLGTDGLIWGAELLDVYEGGYTRLATFAPTALPGGDVAIKNPARQLIARWLEAGNDIPQAWLKELQVSEEELSVWRTQVKKGIHAPQTHAAGRLFDAFSVLLGLAPRYITYEGQAAIRLEGCANPDASNLSSGELPFNTYEKDALLYIDWAPLFSRFSQKIPLKEDPGALAWSFHRAVARAAIQMVQYGLAHTKTRDIVLSGGVFMNRILTKMLLEKLSSLGLNACIHSKVPPNDGGIALGQAVIAG